MPRKRYRRNPKGLKSMRGSRASEPGPYVACGIRRLLENVVSNRDSGLLPRLPVAPRVDDLIFGEQLVDQFCADVRGTCRTAFAVDNGSDEA